MQRIDETPVHKAVREAFVNLIIHASAEKSAESIIDKVCMEELSKRQKQILNCMQEGKSYSTEEVAQMIGLKGPRTRQLLNELVVMKLVSCTAATKSRRYIKEGHNYE